MNSYVVRLVRRGEWIGVLDTVAHAVHLPALFRRPICNAWDRYLGVTEGEMNRKGGCA